MSNAAESATPAPTDLFRLQLSADGKHVQAVYEPRPGATPLDASAVHTMLKAEGYGEWMVIKDAISKLPKLFRDAKQTLTVDIAQKLDAAMSVKISPDEMTALLTVSPAQGGEPVTEGDLIRFLELQKVIFGIQHHLLASVVATQKADQLIIAQGTAPIPGEDSSFKSLLPEISDRRPKEIDHGRVDYRDIGMFFTVKPGVWLLRKTSPTQGVAGTAVTGKVIPSKPGRDINFAGPLSGVIIDPDDKNVLSSAIGGQPILIDHGVRVEPVINLKAVDLTTGNIDFDGTVNVTGDVSAGLLIRTSGDIFITGMVEGAVLEAGGNIKINKGVIGRGELRGADGELNSSVAHIKAGGSVQARFFENTYIEAAGDVLADELLAHCEINAQGSISVGKERAKKGHILGGYMMAMHGITAQVIGSASGVRSKLEAGISRSVRVRLSAVRDAIIAKCAERDKLVTLVSRTGQLPLEMIARASATLESTELDIKKLHDERDGLQKQIATDVYARVTASSKTFECTTLLLGEYSLTVTAEQGPGFFSIVEGAIVHTPA